MATPAALAVGAIVGASLVVAVVTVVMRRERDTLERVRRDLRHQSQVAREALDRSSRLGGVLDALHLGLVVIDRQGVIEVQNDQAIRALSTSAWRAMLDSAMSEIVDELRTNPGSDGAVERVVDIFGPPPRVFRLRASFIETARADDAPSTCVVIEDVTEGQRTERVRRDFVANISHELRTPVGAIGLIAETVRDETESPAPDYDAVRRLAGRACDEVERVSRTIDDLLELSEIELGDNPSSERLDVAGLVEEAGSRMSVVAEGSGIHLGLNAERGLEVVGDRRQLVSAVFNLLDNALKFSEPGSSVDVSVDPAADDGVPTVRIGVRDRGVGIPARDLDRIFERFYRVDRARSRATGGTGLGLAIVRHVAANHGGTVTVQSTEGEGSTFVLELPRSMPTSEGP